MDKLELKWHIDYNMYSVNPFVRSFVLLHYLLTIQSRIVSVLFIVVVFSRSKWIVSFVASTNYMTWPHSAHTQRGSELVNTLGNWNNGKDQETNEENAFDEDEKKTRSNTLSSFSNWYSSANWRHQFYVDCNTLDKFMSILLALSFSRMHLNFAALWRFSIHLKSLRATP